MTWPALPGAEWALLIAFTAVSVIISAAAGLAWWWAFRIHTLYRGMIADAELRRPAAAAPDSAHEALVDALRCERRHRHAAPRPPIRVQLRRTLHREDPFPELAAGQPVTCVYCQGKLCRLCQGCSCEGAGMQCECTQTAAIIGVIA